MKTQKKQLFGGALVCAGLVVGGAANTASADTFETGFQFDPAGGTTTYAYTYDLIFGFQSSSDYSGTGGYVYAGGSINWGRGEVESGYAFIQAYGNGSGFAAGLLAAAAMEISMYAQYDQVLNITYDFGAATDPYYWPVEDYIELNGSNIVDGNNDGMITVYLEAGNLYTLSAFVQASDYFTQGDFAFVTVTAKEYKTPAPGAVVVLGLAGLTGTRRRRDLPQADVNGCSTDAAGRREPQRSRRM